MGHLALGACCLKETRDAGRGRSALQRVLDLDAEGPSRREALRMLAASSWEDGRWEEGLNGYRQLADRYPSDVEAQFKLGYYYLNRTSNRAQAEVHPRRAIDMNPLHPASALARWRLERP